MTAGDADLAALGAVLAEPARARMLLALGDGRALAASVLASEAGVAPSTASEHLARLVGAGLLTVLPQGRHRYYRLAGPEVGELIEMLARMAPAAPVRSLRQGTRAEAVRSARTCYDHLAGRLGVNLFAALLEAGHVAGGDGTHDPLRTHEDRLSAPGKDVDYRLTRSGCAALGELGVALPRARADGTIALRYCVDWSEQRHHMGGAVGRALAGRLLELGWVRRADAGRAVFLTDDGRRELPRLGVELPSPSAGNGNGAARRRSTPTTCDSPPVRVGILGPLEVERDGRPAEVSGGRLRALLARLALESGRPVTSGRLVDAVWEEELPADHVHALQSLVSRLRRSLGSGAIEPAPGGYRLVVDDVDADRFERLAAAGANALRDGDHARAAAQLTDALAIWRGPALADLTGYGFAAAAAARLDDARLTAIADRAEAELALGRGAAHLTELEALAAEHPLHERLAAGLVGALAAAGRQADALDAYERIRARLADELGAAPSPALAQVHLAVLRGETATPPPPAPARRSNLRAAVTSFVGRAEELERIGSLLETSRLVTLVGPGGAGKTRLAQEAAAARADHTPDGVWMVELAPVTSEIEVVPAVLAALGLRNAELLERTTPRPREGLDRLLDVLGDREAILVLDNCEHLIAAAAELADRLLGDCPRLRILATSREPLAIAGESLAPVPPLPLPAPGATAAEALAHPAIELFADRASAARPGFAVDEETVDVCVEICRRLDGLPLAIELAAARLRSMPVHTLAERLDDRFRLLTGGSRTALPRHRTLRAVVDWSWDLLDEPERRLARRLAVLSGGATEASAAAVADADGSDVLDGLTALADRSLLQPVPGTDPPRYRMLETIREYGLEKLADAGEQEATRTRHARHFAALAGEAEPHLRGPGQPEWLRRLEAERDDLVSALRWLGDSGDAARTLKLARDLLWFWILSGSPSEARAWTEFALSVPGEADPHDRLVAEGVQAAAHAATGGGDPESANRELAAIAERLETIGDGGLALLAIARPILAFFAGDQERTTRMLAETLEHPDPWVRAATLLLRAQQAENDGDQRHTRADLELAATAFREVGDAWGLAMVLASQSSSWMMAGDLDEAETALDEALELAEHLSGSTGAGMLSIQVADIRMRRGDLAGAREAALRALGTADLGTDGSIFVTATLARIAAMAGDYDEVGRRLEEAEARLDRLGPQRPEQGHARAFVEAMRARLATAVGDHETAAAAVAAAHAAAVGTTDMPVVAAVGVSAAGVASVAGRHEDGAEMLGAAAALRGAADETNPDVAEVTAVLRDALGDARFDAAYARGRALGRDAAVARFAPAASGAAPVGP